MTADQALAYCGKRVQLRKGHHFAGKIGTADQAEYRRNPGTHVVMIDLDLPGEVVTTACAKIEQLEVLV